MRSQPKKPRKKRATSCKQPKEKQSPRACEGKSGAVEVCEEKELGGELCNPLELRLFGGVRALRVYALVDMAWGLGLLFRGTSGPGFGL